jgi:hypothetical protein
MGRTDYENEFSDAQALTATAVSTNVIDLNDYPQYAGGEDLNVWVTVSTAFTGGTSVQPVLQTDDNTGFSSAAAIHTPPAVTIANATAGATLMRVNLQHLNGVERYIRINYVVVGTPTAGKVDAALEVTPQYSAVTLG